jgi:cytoskeletal protein CcmA (bactofilin family)
MAKTDAGNPPTLLTVTGAAAKLQGRFDVADSLHIECEVDGEIRVGGRLLIGQNASVSAEVHTGDALVHGVYSGTMVATGTVEITATARVIGTIETDSLVIAKGASFNGTVIRAQSAPAAPAAPAPRLAAAR